MLTRIECNGLEFILSGETREKSKGKGREKGEGRKKHEGERKRERERDEEESIREKKSIATCLLARWTQSNLSMYKHDRSIKMGSSRSRAFCSVSITVETDRGHPFHRRQMEQVRRDPHNEKCHGIKRASIGGAFPVPAPGKKTRSNRGRILRKIIPREKKRTTLTNKDPMGKREIFEEREREERGEIPIDLIPRAINFILTRVKFFVYLPTY